VSIKEDLKDLWSYLFNPFNLLGKIVLFPIICLIFVLVSLMELIFMRRYK